VHLTNCYNIHLIFFLLVMAWLNNIIELRSDAFKIITHCRRPIPRRTDTIGPWLSCIEFLAWAGALINAALVYLFRPASSSPSSPIPPTFSDGIHNLTAGDNMSTVPIARGATTRDAVIQAALLALGASHAFIAVRTVVRHVLERVLWRGSKDEARVEKAEREVKETYLKSLELDKIEASSSAGEKKKKSAGGATTTKEMDEFWEFDDGLEEIRRAVKDL
jgi:anoctamin-10